MDRPIIAIPMGDPAGVGPEIIAMSLAQEYPYTICRPLVVGDAAMMELGIQAAKVDLRVRAVSTVAEAQFERGVVDVYDKAFYGCASLESVEIPQNVTFLGNYCFDGCAQLREVVIRGDRVVDIGSTAFRNCHAELTIRVPSAMLENYRKNELWESYLDRLQPID